MYVSYIGQQTFLSWDDINDVSTHLYARHGPAKHFEPAAMNRNRWHQGILNRTRQR
jgi:hypothetical protein